MLQYELVGDPEERMTVPESWARGARRQPRLATGRRFAADDEDDMVQQALAASLLLGVS